MASGGQDAKFFARGKIQEFRNELKEAETKDKKFVKRKVILKKIVANITMGNDSKLARIHRLISALTVVACL
jgi:AP-2 complex subunit beta-1